MVDYEMEQIRNYVGDSNFSKGVSYPRRYVDLDDTYVENGIKTNIFSVESERSYDFYEVIIQSKKDRILSSSCTCPQYHNFSMCKHIAACLIQHKSRILECDLETQKLRLSRGILEQFYEAPRENQIRLKKQITLTFSVFFEEGYYGSSVSLNFKIGEDKLYNFNNKMNRFLRVYGNENEEVVFGKNFVYSPKTHFFSEEDQKMIDFLAGLYRKNPYYNFQNLSISTTDFGRLLDLIPNKSFEIINYGMIHHISNSNPIPALLRQENGQYHLSFGMKDIGFLCEDFQFVAIDDTLYRLPSKVASVLALMYQNQLSELVFSEEDFTLFQQGILPLVSKNVVLDQSIEGKIVLGVKPQIQIYLDLKDGIILCDVRLTYQDKEIHYFDDTPNIVRDTSVEQGVIGDLLQYGFLVSDKQIYMDDLNTIGAFLEENLILLASKYEVFTTDKMKKTKIMKNMNVSSTFHIGQDNILRYEFDLGGIPNQEIVDILSSFKNKKKYYRLKSGDLVDLTQNDELKQLESLAHDMDLSDKDLKNGSGEIPKYRAIYLDSVKREKYHIIKTNNLFDELISNFNSYKDVKLSLSSRDKKILRDYQEVGVKWLYNIYKCGFGGILADEMGLGKSIQLIYFIREVLKEKKDAKILIVAPTSLVYNWKNEFDKFGSDISYRVLAEHKNVRKMALEHLDDVNVIITTYGLVRQDREQYMNMSFEVVAIDEAQNIKNANAQMTKIVKALKANTKLALTGTPLENSVLELWSIFDFIMPGYLANHMTFRRKYNIKDVDEDNLKLLDTLNEQIKPFILRRRKKDVVKELPDKIENNISIDLNPEQKKLYVAQLEKTKKELDDILANEGFEKGNFKILQLLTKLRQLCIDPRILYENYEGGSSKIDNLITLVEGIIANGHKILLFTSYRMALDIVKQEFDKHDISYYVIDGSVSSKKRMELVDKFNHDDTNVFLITLKAGGTGLNLTSADVVIHLDLWWNPQVENQATDRAHRIGQKNTVEVIKLICKGTIEERILELQNKKKILSDKLIEGEDRDKNILSKLTEKDIKNLLSLDNEEE